MMLCCGAGCLVASVVSAGLALDVPGDRLGVFVTNCRCVGTSICVVARKKRTPGATRDDWDRSAQGHAGFALFDGSAMLAVVTSKTKCREQTSIVAAYTRPAERFVNYEVDDWQPFTALCEARPVGSCGRDLSVRGLLLSESAVARQRNHDPDQ
jgi:hypothetical protein